MLAHPRSHAVERAWDKPLDTGSLRAMITLPLGGGRGCPGWLAHPRSHAVERAWDKPLDTGPLCAVIRLPLWGGHGASERADELTSQHKPAVGPMIVGTPTLDRVQALWPKAKTGSPARPSAT